MKTIILFITIVVLSYQGMSQTTKKSEKIYYSISEALELPEKVYILDLSKNALKKLPNEISRFKNLKKLIVSDNLLSELPQWISQLRKMQQIYLSNNQFEKYPEELNKCNSLVLIDLSCNPIRAVTMDKTSYPNLSVLNLHHNKINFKSYRRLKHKLGNVLID